MLAIKEKHLLKILNRFKLLILCIIQVNIIIQ